MNKMSRFAVCAVALVMIAFGPARMIWAADDNASVAQVYLEFDPATGEFKSVPATPENSPDGSMMSHKGNHAAAAPADTQQNTQQSAPAPAQTAGTPAAGASGTAQGSGPSPVIIGAIVALVVVGGVVLTLRKKTA